MSTRRESAADITVTIGEEEVVVETLSVTKNVDVETIYGSGQTLPDGFSINQVAYEGDMSCKGNKMDLEEKFFDEHGIPKVLDAITVSHFDGSSSALQEIIVTSEGYEMNSGETTETSFSFLAMKKARNGIADSDPSDN
ncbi:hypothetical protein [Halapricum desulfuricans]|uniref:Uncharacterized protein n=1 Tax=Halapricum desulfuricans TaxID=2841257 RepID=A0A897N140_9EURY|nr:hypothetical protein [Halapricum desulfuricans]QSG06404.1 hypothetical protein HSR121_2072 [Halapricum desulfuricans]